MKKINQTLLLSFLIAGISQSVFAEEQDLIAPEHSTPYVGVQVGTTSMGYNANEWSKVNTTSFDNHQFFGRAYLGYAFSDFLATELGYTYYDNPTLTENNTGLKEDFYQYGFDLSGLASIQFSHGFGLYGKAGATWIFRGDVTENQYFKEHSSNSKIAPLLGCGVTYEFNQHFMTDLAWTRVFSNGDLPKIDHFSLGLTYRLF